VRRRPCLRLYPGALLTLGGCFWLLPVLYSSPAQAAALLPGLLCLTLVIGWLLTPAFFADSPANGFCEVAVFLALPLPLIILCLALGTAPVARTALFMTAAFAALTLFGVLTEWSRRTLTGIHAQTAAITFMQTAAPLAVAIHYDKITHWLTS